MIPKGEQFRETGLEPFVVRAPWHDGLLDFQPLGWGVEHRVDATSLAAGAFGDRLSTLDALTFGPEGMPMPRWLFYEASSLPGAIFGFGIDAGRLTNELRERLRLEPGAGGLVPISMYIAIPARAGGVWLGHNLASLSRVLPELGLEGLGTLTKAHALACFRCTAQLGATQWDSPAVHVHARFGPLELLTAWTPAHAFPATFTYHVLVNQGVLLAAAGDDEAPAIERAAPDFHIEAGDEEAMQALQARVEAGERFAVSGPPDRDGERTLVPVSAVR